MAHDNHRPFDPAAAADPDAGIFGMSSPADNCLVHLIPVPFEATTSYGRGTAKGPQAIVKASHQLDLVDLECGEPWREGIVMLPEAKEIRLANAQALTHVGGAEEGNENDLAAVNHAGETVNLEVRAAAERAFDAGKVVGLVGGDHASPFGLIEVLSERHPGMGIFHIDAHLDLREAFEGFTWSHASIMHNVMTRLDGVSKLVQVGIRDFSAEEKAMADASGGRIAAHYDHDFARARLAGAAFDDLARPMIDDLPQEVYVSFDIDGLDPKLCPNTGTPVPGGLDFHEALRFISLIVESGRTIVGFDLCEVSPGEDEWDANVGARILYKLIGYTLVSRREA